MSALIKVKELEVDEFIFKKVKHTLVVIPHIISYENESVEERIIVNKKNINTLKISEQEFNEITTYDEFTMIVYCVNYIDSTNTKKTINFQHKEDAEKFLSELKSCINKFYNNSDAYVKFIN